MDIDHRWADTPVLTQRMGREGPPVGCEEGDVPRLKLALDADQRTRLRGQRQTACGRDLVLQLPRGDALEPGEWLTTADATVRVVVEAAPEPLLVVTAADPVHLLQAAYHLGNRHVALQVERKELRLLDDPVLAALLLGRGLRVERRVGAFLPEAGAYAGATAHGHSHGHSHGPT